MRVDRRASSAAPAQRRDVRARLVALTTKIYFDGGCRPNPGSIRVAVVVRGAARIDDALGEGSSGRAEWLALLYALEVASAAGETDVTLFGDSASVIDQARGVARRQLTPDEEARFALLSARFDRLRYRRIKRSQNLAGIALEQSYGRSKRT